MAAPIPTTVSLRLDKDLATRLKQAAKSAGVTKSEYIRQCLTKLLDAEKQPQPTAWELGQDLFGRYRSGQGDLSTRRKALAQEKIRDNFAAENRRRQRLDRRPD